MYRSPQIRRLLTAVVAVLGLLALFATPTLAQDDPGTPVPDQSAAAETGGTVTLLYYVCDGGPAGLSFDVADPGAGNPDKPSDDCALATAETDTTFLVYVGGDLTSTPIEVTTVLGTVTVPLAATNGTPDKITEKLPDDAPADQEPVQADFEVVDGQDTGVNAILFRTGEIEIHAFTCTGDPADNAFDVLDPGLPFDGTPFADCAPFEGDFYVAPFGDQANQLDPVTSTTGDVTADGIPTTTAASGQHSIRLRLSDTPETYTDPATFDVSAGQTTQLVWVQFAPPTGTLQVNKIVCQGDGETEFYVNEDAPEATDNSLTCAPQSASFSIYIAGDTESDPLTFSTNNAGIAEVDDLPVTTQADPHLLSEDGTDAQTTFDIVADETTVVNVVNFEPVQPTAGTVEITVLDCAGLADSSVISMVPGDTAPDVPAACDSSAHRFLIFPNADANADPIDLTVNGFKSFTLNVDGSEDFLVQEVDGDDNVIVSGTFTVADGLTTPVQVRNATYGRVVISAYVCDGTDNPAFDVADPGQSADQPTDCTALDRSFTITLFGDGEQVTVATGDAGTVELDGVPTTADSAHVIVTSGAMASAAFDVDANTTTEIVYTVYQPADTTGGTTDDTSDSENVTAVADTGIGFAAGGSGSNAGLLFGIVSLWGVIALAAYTRRRTA